MLGATFGVVGSISETADATDSETADAAGADRTVAKWETDGTFVNVSY